jgi:hypothetical protein
LVEIVEQQRRPLLENHAASMRLRKLGAMRHASFFSYFSSVFFLSSGLSAFKEAAERETRKHGRRR